MTPTRLSIIGVLLTITLCQCKKEEHYQFGEPNYSIVTDSIYYCKSDGFLKVDLIERAEPYFNGSPSAWIYSDENPEPSTQAAIIYNSTTIPINKGMYYIIRESNPKNEYLISWTPTVYEQ